MLTTEKQNIVLAMHKNPDGDACGAAWAIKLALEKKYPDKNVYLFSNSPTTKFSHAHHFTDVKFTSYEDLPEDNELYILDHFDQDYSLVPDWRAEKFTAWKVIDHHRASTSALKLKRRKEEKEESYINLSAGSTCEIIFDYMKENEEHLITPEVAASLFLGIKSDSCNMTVDTRTEVIDMLHSLIHTYKCKELVETRKITGSTGRFSFFKGMAKPILRMRKINDIVFLKLKRSDYEHVTKKEKISCGRMISFLLQLENTNHVILTYEYAPKMWNITIRTKKKGLTERTAKALDLKRHFMEFGLTVLGINQGPEQKTLLEKLDLIFAVIKDFTNH